MPSDEQPDLRPVEPSAPARKLAADINAQDDVEEALIAGAGPQLANAGEMAVNWAKSLSGQLITSDDIDRLATRVVREGVRAYAKGATSIAKHAFRSIEVDRELEAADEGEVAAMPVLTRKARKGAKAK